MKSSDILLTLQGKPLEVWHQEGSIIDGTHYHICVKYAHSSIKAEDSLQECFGMGKTFEDACDEYLSWIRGKTLVFSGDDRYEEVRVLG